MTPFIEPIELLDLVLESGVCGVETPTNAILRHSAELLAVSEPSLTPLDVNTYRVRRARWQSGNGPSLTGIDTFIEVLESPSEPVSVVSAAGETTTYVCLLNARRTRAVAVLAVDAPRADGQSPQ